MIVQLNMAQGMSFHALALSLGISDETVMKMRRQQLTGCEYQFVWGSVQAASDRLMSIEPMGSC